MQLYNVSLLASQQLHLPACCAPRNSASRDASLCLTIAVLGFLVVACAMFSFFQDYPFREYFRGLTTNELKILTILTFMSSSQIRYSVLSSLNCFSSAFCCCKVSVNHWNLPSSSPDRHMSVLSISLLFDFAHLWSTRYTRQSFLDPNHWEKTTTYEQVVILETATHLVCRHVALHDGTIILDLCDRFIWIR